MRTDKLEPEGGLPTRDLRIAVHYTELGMVHREGGRWTVELDGGGG